MPHAGRRLLDYGCGDGTFLAVISDLFPNAMGTDADQRQVENCKQRFEKITSLSFKSVQELTDPGYQQFFDVVICTEVLEHCLDAEANKLLHNLNGLCAQGGIIIISVPVEIGPALIVKQVVRMIAGWRRIGYYEYRERYTPKDFWRMLFADADTSIARVVHSYGNAIGFHGHHGFNWRTLETRISRLLTISTVRFSPLGWSRGFLSSQVWFVCNPARPKTAELRPVEPMCQVGSDTKIHTMRCRLPAVERQTHSETRQRIPCLSQRTEIRGKEKIGPDRQTNPSVDKSS
jgi:SAM-dependent methyltransferase